MKKTGVFIVLALVAGCTGSSSPGTDGGPSDATDGADTGADSAITFGAPTWVKDGVFYHVYVRAFADSDGDGIGDLPGLTARLDHIAGLGVTGILLLPVFEGYGWDSGGYLTTDYQHIEADYGGDATWDTFIAAAHARGLKVALDLSLTLVSTEHPWFQAAKANPLGPERADFLRAGPPCPTLTNKAGQNGWAEFGPGDECYWCDYPAIACASLDVRVPATRQALIDIGLYWFARGADGFRLDSAASIAQVDPANPTVIDPSSPATHAFWADFMRQLKTADPAAFTIAELWDTTPAFFADGIDLSFDYLTWYGAFWSWQNGLAQSGAAFTGVAELLPYQIGLRKPGFWGGAFLGNHDAPGEGAFGPVRGRIADLLCPAPCTDVAPLRAALMFQLALPATPFVYFGEEIGLHGGPNPGGQIWSRNPMHWDATVNHGFTSGTPQIALAADTTSVAEQDGKQDSLLSAYRALIPKRRASPALTKGDFVPVAASGPELLAFLRRDPSERILVVVNFANATVQATLDLASAGVSAAAVTEYLFGSSLPTVDASNAGAYPVTLPARGAVWLKLQ